MTLAILVSGSACASPEPADPDTSLPTEGVLFFHRYSEYSAWDATLWELDLASGGLARIDADWRHVRSPINAHPDAAGDAITFMATSADLPQPEWDVFVSHWDGERWAEPVNLTGPNGRRDEDPKFGPDGRTIVFKEDGVLATIDIDGGSRTLLTQGRAASSMPYFTPDGTGIMFERAGSILLLRNGTESVLWQAAATHAYYPIGASRSRFLFTEVQASHHDRIVWGSYTGKPAVPMWFGSDDCDNSDPYPYRSGERFVFYVTGCPLVLKGGYNLAVADRATRTLHDLDERNPQANSHDQELGPAWSGTAPFPVTLEGTT